MADALAHLLFVRALVQSYVFALKACLNRFISSGVRDRSIEAKSFGSRGRLNLPYQMLFA